MSVKIKKGGEQRGEGGECLKKDEKKANKGAREGHEVGKTCSRLGQKNRTKIDVSDKKDATYRRDSNADQYSESECCISSKLFSYILTPQAFY